MEPSLAATPELRAWPTPTLAAPDTVDDVCAALRGTLLNLSGREIGDAQAAVIAKALTTAPQLKKVKMIYLYNNQISEAGMRTLGPALAFCSRLQTLNMHTNALGDEGAAVLASILPTCSALRQVNVSHNNIGDAGAASLAAVLKNCPKLHTFFIHLNPLTDVGGLAIAAVLKDCHRLHELQLNESQITTVTAQALLAALPQCPTLNALEMNDIHSAEGVATAVRRQIEAVLRRRPPFDEPPSSDEERNTVLPTKRASEAAESVEVGADNGAEQGRSTRQRRRIAKQ